MKRQQERRINKQGLTDVYRMFRGDARVQRLLCAVPFSSPKNLIINFKFFLLKILFYQQLEKNNLRYVIIRGFNKLQITPDKDLDIVCHPEDLDKVKDIMLKELHLMNSKIIQIGLEKVNYVQFKTKNIPNNLIKNTYFHIDIYDNINTNDNVYMNMKKTILEIIFCCIIFNIKI